QRQSVLWTPIRRDQRAHVGEICGRGRRHAAQYRTSPRMRRGSGRAEAAAHVAEYAGDVRPLERDRVVEAGAAIAAARLPDVLVSRVDRPERRHALPDRESSPRGREAGGEAEQEAHQSILEETWP